MAAPSATRDAGPGQLLFDRYRLLSRLGLGGSAEVWRAHDEHLGRDVALKLLHPYLVEDAAARQRILAEARAVAGLSHPGIVTIHDAVEGDGRVGLILELVEGRSVAERLAEAGPLSGTAAAAIIAQIADALQAAHDQGLVHRDVKPANILVSDAGHARLADFGIARALDGASAAATAPGTVMGTLRSMAPEQLAGAPATPASDVFGLGAVLYELLAGRPPFPASAPAELIARQAAGAPSVPGADPELVDLARAALKRAPDERPPSAGAMADRLGDWLARRAITAREWPAAAAAGLGPPALNASPQVGPPPDPDLVATVPVPVGAQVPVAGSAAAHRDPSALRRPRSRTAALALAGVLLLALVGVALAGLGDGRPAALANDPSPSPTAVPARIATPAPTGSPGPGATAKPAPTARPVVVSEQPAGDKARPGKGKGKDKRKGD